MKRNTAVLGLTLFLTTSLAGCAGKPDQSPDATGENSSSPAGTGSLQLPRPSSALGVYVTTFLSEGIFLPVRTATSGVSAAGAIVSSQQDTLKDESFLLLQELGGALQITITDTLNRSENRIQTLDQYSEALKNLILRGDRQVVELDASIQDLRQKNTEQSGKVNALQQAISKAFASKDYATASSRQEELTKAQGELAQTQLKMRQTTDLRQQFTNLLRTAKARQTAINNNREALLSGIAITDDPALKDLGIINPSSKRSTTNPWSVDF